MAQDDLSKIRALSYIVIDAQNGRVLFGKNIHLRLAPASTTKVMTGLLLVEKTNPTDLIIAPTNVAETKESSMHLVPGEAVASYDMLFALMLRSANDGCFAVAHHIAGGVQAFAALMNKRAKELGCLNTTFQNPHGLPDPNHKTTAYDLSRIALEAMKHPRFCEAVHTQKKVIKRSLNQLDIVMVNRDRWLKMDPSALGIKTGFTKDAGQCFVGCSERNGMKIITVLMKSDHWLEDQMELVDYTFNNFELREISDGFSGKLRRKIGNGTRDTAKFVIQGSPKLILKADRSEIIELVDDSPSVLEAPIAAGESTFDAKLKIGDYEVPVKMVAEESVKAQHPMVANLTTPGGILGFVLLSGGAYWMRWRSRRLID